MIQVFFNRYPDALLSGSGDILHFAPEMQVRNLLQGEGRRCFSMDIAPEKLRPLTGPRFQADAQRLPLPDAVFDAAAVLHMLEHVDDDRAAISEIARVIKSGGKALIMVPFGMHLARTMEFGRGNERMFGHVRDYSPLDFSERLHGFQVQTFTPTDLLSPEEQRRFKIPGSQIIFLCTK